MSNKDRRLTTQECIDKKRRLLKKPELVESKGGCRSHAPTRYPRPARRPGGPRVECANPIRVAGREMQEPVRKAKLFGNVFDLLKDVRLSKEDRIIGTMILPSMRVTGLHVIWDCQSSGDREISSRTTLLTAITHDSRCIFPFSPGRTLLSGEATSILWAHTRYLQDDTFFSVYIQESSL